MSIQPPATETNHIRFHGRCTLFVRVHFLLPPKNIPLSKGFLPCVEFNNLPPRPSNSTSAVTPRAGRKLVDLEIEAHLYIIYLWHLNFCRRKISAAIILRFPLCVLVHSLFFPTPECCQLLPTPPANCLGGGYGLGEGTYRQKSQNFFFLERFRMTET